MHRATALCGVSCVALITFAGTGAASPPALPASTGGTTHGATVTALAVPRTAPPRHLRLVRRTGRSLVVTWPAPTRRTGPVRYATFLSGRRRGLTSRRTATFAGLSCGRRYAVGVAAWTPGRGWSRIRGVVARTLGCDAARIGPTPAPLGAGGAGLPPRLPASTGATFWVATTGSDGNPGTSVAPWRTIQRALDTLRPGEQAVVRGGTYVESIVAVRGGTASAPITIRNAPGERAVIRPASGRPNNMPLDLERGAAYLRFQGLAFLGANGPETTNVYAAPGAHDVEFFQCEIAGSARQGLMSERDTSGIQIVACDVHDNGGSGPSDRDHNVYLQGSGHVVASSLIRNARNGTGIQIYPSTSRVTVAANTIVDNGLDGVLVGGDGAATTTGARVVGNILAFNGRYGLSTYWGGPVGTGNVATTNLSFGNRLDGLVGSGISLSGNLTGDPQFADRPLGDFHLRATSPAVGRGVLRDTPAVDVEGSPRPRGAPDLGAYEAG